MIVDQSSWGQLRVTGEDRARFLQGMVTNDVAALAVGASCRAVLLNVKGRVLAVVDIVNEGDAFVVVTEPETTTKVQQLLEKHAIVDDVVFEPLQRPLHRVWDSAASVWTAPPVFAPAPAGAVAWGSPEAEVRRVEALLPRYGLDVSEDYFPFEAHLDSAISFKKGCYIGQEVVARANARGHANKRLVQLRLDGEGPVAPGTKISAEVREDAGVVTSSAVSPELGPLALGYVHKSAWEPGTRLKVGERQGSVA